LEILDRFQDFQCFWFEKLDVSCEVDIQLWQKHNKYIEVFHDFYLFIFFFVFLDYFDSKINTT